MNAGGPAPVIVQHAEVRDYPALGRLQIDSWRDAYAGLLPAEYLAGPMAAEITAHWDKVDSAEIILCAAGHGGDILGFARAQIRDKTGPSLDNLHCRPDLRGQGIGARLFEAVVGHLVREGHSTLRLEVMEQNTGARAFYRRRGGIEGPIYDVPTHGAPCPCRQVRWEGLPTSSFGQTSGFPA